MLKHMNNPLSILIETVVTASITPTTVLESKMLFEEDTPENDKLIEIFTAALDELLKDSLIVPSVNAIASPVAVTVNHNKVYKTIVNVRFDVEKLQKAGKLNVGIFESLTGLMKACMRLSVKTKNTRDLYEAIEKDVKMYQPGTPAKKQARNKR